MVIKEFCPQYEVDRIEKKFLNLSAGKMSHSEYTAQFNKMARMVPHQVDTVERRIKCYVDGFPSNVHVHVKAHRPSTFESVVELAGIV